MTALVVVTGGSRGLGAALLAAAPAGAELVTVSRSGPADGPRGVTHVAADLADPATWPEVGRRVARWLEDEWQRVVLWHAAGTLDPLGFAGEVDEAAYTANVLLNSACGQVLGAHFLAAAAPREGIRRELGLISSGAARRAYPGWSAYGAGKAAMDQWARAVAQEQAARGGVRVLSVTPGVVDTPMQRRIRETDPADFPAVERFRGLHRRGELEDADEVARRLWAALDAPGDDPVIDLREY